MFQVRFGRLCWLLLFAVHCAAVRATAAADDRPSPHDAITAGCTLVGGGNLGSRCTATAPGFEPLLWCGPRANGGDKLGLQGTLPVAGWAGYHGAGRVLLWSMHEAMWQSGKDGLDDNDKFREQAFGWLLAGRKRVACTSGHSEYVHAADLSSHLRAWLDTQGVSCTDLPGVIDASALASCDLLVIGQPAPFAKSEINALAAWVNGGGSLLLCAQGWSWDYGKGDHPLNRIAAPFGLHMEGGNVTDPTAPNGQSSTPNFKVQPLSAYTPAKVIVLKKGVDDLGSVKTLAAQQPGNLFVLEGDHFGLQVPTADWPRLNAPAAAVDMLDKMYLKEAEYAGGHPPFGGAVIWAISVDDPEGKYWLHSGNPIVMKLGAGREVVDNFNQYGVPGWGLAHENGHNMSIDACGNLYVPYGLVEPNANVFSVWTFNQLGWDWACGHKDYAAAGVAYHRQAHPDMAQMKSDLWIMLGCFDLIWQRYGFDGMQAFLSQAGADHAAGMQAGDDDARVKYLVEGLSRAYHRDFSALFIHWGFPVTTTTQSYTAQFPPSDIPIP